VLLVVGLAFAQHPRGVPREDGAFQVLGSTSCRACHRAIFRQWERSSHALSTAKLTFEQTFDADCEPCHAPDAEAFEDGVGCEACHGPGSEYSALDVMIDDLKRRAAGLQDAAANCVACHNPGHPFHVERDLESAARTIHPR
jgi:tartrate dehydratase alpha subunit/fumarate hydratase class I-like protein